MRGGGRALGVTGTAVEDTIVRPGEPVVEDMGGVYYAVSTLRALLPGDVTIRPVLAVGDDAFDRVAGDFQSMSGVAVEGLRRVDAVNNKVRLVYRSAGEREETLTGGVGPLPWEALEPWIDRLDAWLWNFVSGLEADLETFVRVKAAFAGPIHLDVHSLCLEPPGDGPRGRRRPDRWEAWVEGAAWVQCNEIEAALLWAGEEEPMAGEEEAALAERVRGLGAEGLLVTRGEAGATWHGADGRVDVPVAGAGAAVDPTGCGDVAGAAWVAWRWGHGLDPAAALERAVAAAGRAAAVEGTRRLTEALRERGVHPGGGDR